MLFKEKVKWIFISHSLDCVFNRASVHVYN